MAKEKPVGFIGLGTMGKPMAMNLVRAGYDLIVYNRTQEKVRQSGLVAAGAKDAASPREVGERAEIIFLMLTDPAAVEQILFGKDGVVDGARAGALIVDCSTVSPTFSRSLAGRLREKEIMFLDAPVTGSKQAAENAELVFLVGGEMENVAVVKPLLEKMGKAVFHLGGVGMGSSAKLAVNLILGTMMVALAEGLHFAESLRVPREKLLEVISMSAIQSPLFRLKGMVIQQEDYTPSFALNLMLKDLRLINDEAARSNTPLPVTGLVKELYTSAVANGFGGEDFAAVFKFYKFLKAAPKKKD